MGLKIAIVESENDKFFIEAFLKARNLDISLESSPICSIDDYECLNGDSLTKIIAALSAIRNRSRKDDIDAIGIILDHDNKSSSLRIEQVNDAIKKAFDIESDILEKIGDIKEVAIDETIKINIGLYLQNVGSKGNLETVLKVISKGDSVHADCLEAWRACLTSQKLQIRDADFDKFWIQIYQRYDQCSKTEKKQAGRKCNNEASLKKDIWNFKHKVLDKLYVFLKSL